MHICFINRSRYKPPSCGLQDLRLRERPAVGRTGQHLERELRGSGCPDLLRVKIRRGMEVVVVDGLRQLKFHQSALCEVGLPP